MANEPSPDLRRQERDLLVALKKGRELFHLSRDFDLVTEEGWSSPRRYEVLFRRGFADKLRGSLADLLTVGEQLDGWTPLLRTIAVTDRRPFNRNPFKAQWWLVRPDRDVDTDDLPQEVFERLTGGRLSPSSYGTQVRDYLNEEAAVQDLSDARLSLIKSRI